MTGRAKGEGSIYQAADGRWHGSMDLGAKANGKRYRRHVTAKTKTAVAKKLKQLRDDRGCGVVGGGREITVEVWATKWLADSSRPVEATDHRRVPHLHPPLHRPVRGPHPPRPAQPLRL